MNIKDRLKGCIIGGAIGDAWGSAFENIQKSDHKTTTYFPFGKPNNTNIKSEWKLTDDTQLTCATLEAMLEDKMLNPEVVSAYFLKWYKENELTGLGSSTLMALQGLDAGGHWSQVGRRGEYAAGNGAAMRIVPLAFNVKLTKEKVREISLITHNNDEAYVGALAVVTAVRSILNGKWTGKNSLISEIIKYIPDSKVRDRLLMVECIEKLEDVGLLGNSGYVVDSVPLAIAAANQVRNLGIEKVYQTLINIGGDTDTNCSIAGQIAGCYLGYSNIPDNLKLKIKQVNGIERIFKTLNNLNMSGDYC